MRAARELGDYQTPPELAEAVVASLRQTLLRCERAVEPTCGMGGFIAALLAAPGSIIEVIGVEIAAAHLAASRERFRGAPQVRIVAGNIFDEDIHAERLWNGRGPLLIFGNPPWVTNAAIGVDGGSNLPKKENLKNLWGMDAITGGSNFDIAEWIILRLLGNVGSGQAHLALLCKSSVARNVVEYARTQGWPLSKAAVRVIDAKRWFNASVDAGLFTCTMNDGEASYDLAHYASLDAVEPSHTTGAAGGKAVANFAAYQPVKFLEGESHIEWRQGVKHDAAPAMELLDEHGRLVNESGAVVDVEAEYVFPLYKGSDLGGRAKLHGRRRVIVTQRRIGEDTTHLATSAPRLWAYLTGHRDRFDARKSSIYMGNPPFSMFGVGPYTFTTAKVAVSGLHKVPRFEAFLALPGEQPAVFDDTCYVLPCESAVQAAACEFTLNHPMVRDFLRSVAFSDTKRPITKKVLGRVNFLLAAERIDAEEARAGVAAVLKRLAPQVPLPGDFSLATAVGRPARDG